MSQRRMPTDPQLPLDQVILGNCLDVLPTLPEASVDMVFADPPYNLQLQQELRRPNNSLVDAVDDDWDHFASFAEYDRFTEDWLAACRRVLKPTGTLWVIGSYHNIFRVGKILQDLSYWILNDIVWIKCLTGDTELYAQINGHPIVSTLKDLVRIDLSQNNIQLPSYDNKGGFTWVDLQQWQVNPKSNGLRIELEDGTWVECTPQHQFPVPKNGVTLMLQADEFKVGDELLQLGRFKITEIITSEWNGDLRPVKIKAITPANQKVYYDLAVNGNHVFALANGLLTHNSNPMPNFRGVRFTNAHETLIWAQRERGVSYTFNHQAMKALNEDLQMRSDWFLPICTGKERLRVNGLKAHPTQKPESLLYRVLLATTNPGEVVLDPFFGTGTTGALAKRLHRHYIGIERNPRYVTLARQRIERMLQTEFDPPLFVTPSPRHQVRIPFGSLVENGLLQAGQMLYFGSSDGVSARILADGSLEYDGQRGSIHQIARLIRRGPCNGWEVWFYVDEATQQRLAIEHLRQQMRAEHTEE